MSEVKWIKITTDIFDDEKILLIESLPDSDAIIVIWFKLLCLAGKMNNSGVFVLNDKIPITETMLATIFRRKETIIKLALDTFEQFGMVEIINNVITIPNWAKHQNLDALEKNKEYMREYMKNYRMKQKGKTSLPSGDQDNADSDEQPSKLNSKTNSKTNVSVLEEDKDIEEDIYNTISAEQKNCSTPILVFMPLNTGEEYPIYESDVNEWTKLYPDVDVKQELNNMRGWCLANPSKRKTKSGVKRFINSWLSKTQNKGGTNGYTPNSSGKNEESRGQKKYKEVIDENGFVAYKEIKDGTD